MHIVRALLDGPKGFNELGREIGGCNPTTLAQRLERLESLGILEKTVCSVMPPKSSYSLTAAGTALQTVINAIHDWAAEHLNVAEKKRFELSHRQKSVTVSGPA